jgi:hypothetical protein
MKNEKPNLFRAELEQNILAKIKQLKKEQTTGMSVENLIQVTPTPKATQGAIYGTNAPYYYREMFREIAQANPTIRNFTIR